MLLMKNIRIFYFHTLDLTFKSAQTIQVAQDYDHLSNLGVNISLFGLYKNEDDYLLIKEFFNNSKVNLVGKRYSLFNKLYIKIIFYKNLFATKSNKIVVTRHYRKLRIILKIKKYARNIKIIHEMHEESLPHLFKTNVSKTDIKSLFFNKSLDLMVFTNYSQQVLFKKEFGDLPHSVIVLPNGVELEKFNQVLMSSNYVITYGGGFNKWKNVELVFEALSILEDKYSLRIAGGKGDLQSDLYIDNLINKFDINPSRVDYLGFVNNKDFAKKVLNKSNLLLLPLGDNIQSKYLTSPMKLFEYMATKIPILAVNFPSISLITNDTIYLSSMKAKDFADKIVEICEQNVQDFDSSSMNKIAEKYSYKNRSLSLYKQIVNGLF